MYNYKIKVDMTHIFTSQEEFIAEVKAKNLNEAKELAKEQAKRFRDTSAFDAEIEDTEIDHIDLIDTNAPEEPIRCPNTIDLFN
jgi:hypothetical protein